MALQAQTPPPEPAPAQEPTPLPVPPPTETLSPAPPGGKLLDLDVDRQEVPQFLKKLSVQAGVKVRAVGYLPMLLTLKLDRVNFDEALKAVCQTLGITFKKTDEGTYFVGYASDLLLEFADTNDTTEVDVTYRCRHLGADSLANVITKAVSISGM